MKRGIVPGTFDPITSGHLDIVERRDHRKLLVIDGRLAFTGGINLAREWLAVDDGGAFTDSNVPPGFPRAVNWAFMAALVFASRAPPAR